MTHKVGFWQVVSVLKLANPFWAVMFLLFVTLILGWELGALTMLSLVVHELGHGWAMMRYGLRITKFSFIPLGGAIIVTDGSLKGRHQETVMALMGPAWGCLMTLIIMPFVWVIDDPLLVNWLLLTAFINLFNLLPINPMDGGRAIKSIVFTFSNTAGWIVQVMGLVAAGFLAVYVNPIVGAIVAFIAYGELRRDILVRNQDKDREKIINALARHLEIEPSADRVIGEIQLISAWPSDKIKAWMLSRDIFRARTKVFVEEDSVPAGAYRTAFLDCISDIAYQAAQEKSSFVLLSFGEQVVGRYECMAEDDDSQTPLINLIRNLQSLKPMGKGHAWFYLGCYLLLSAILVGAYLLTSSFLNGTIIIFG